MLPCSPSPLRPDAWAEHLSEYPGDLPQLIAGILRHGALTGYEGPAQLILSDNLSSATSAPEDIDTQIQKDLSLGRVRPVHPSAPFIASPLGLVPKSDGGWRRIHHLSYPPERSVNDNIQPRYAAIQYVSFDEIVGSILKAGRGCCILKWDIKDAFRNIPVAPSQHWLLGFQWQGCFYHETVLSFGLRTAPVLFNLFAEGFHWILLKAGFRFLHHYLDDFVAVVPPGFPPQPYEHTFLRLASELGIPIKTDKCASGQTVTVLGVEFDTISLEARLPPDKIQKVIRQISAIMDKGTITRREAEELAGRLQWYSGVVRLGRAFIRSLYVFISQGPRPFVPQRLPSRVRRDLTWWRDLLPVFNGVRLLDDDGRTVTHLHTDASDFGLGGYFTAADEDTPRPDQAFAHRVNKRHRGQGIHFKELRAVLTALKLWAHRWSHHKLVVFTDNKLVEHALLKTSSKGAPEFMDLLQQLLLLAAAHDLTLVPEWLPSAENTLADALSRLNLKVVTNLCPHWQVTAEFTNLRHLFETT